MCPLKDAGRPEVRWSGRTLGRVSAVMMVFAGAGLMALPAIREARGEWGQHQLATSSDASISRYRNAVAGAYDVAVSDFEDALVSFEIGALPSADGARLLGVATASTPGSASNDNLIGDGQSGTAASNLPPPVFAGAIVTIPAIGVNQAVVEGVGRSDLRKGPGHYPGTAVPGYSGNVVISGHRTTYTKPFYDVDLLVAGDVIVIDTSEGSFRYLVERSYVVSPDDLSPLMATDEAVLTLTTCTPKGSARSRLVVVANLEGAPIDLTQ